MTRALAESSSLSEATPKLLQYICEAVGWEVGELWYVNADSNTLHIEGSWHVPSYEVEEFEKASRKTILFPGIDLVGRVLSSNQPAWIDNVVADKNFPRAPIADGSPAVGNRRRCLAWRAGRGRIVVFRVALRAIRAREHDLLTTAQGDTLEQRTDRY